MTKTLRLAGMALLGVLAAGPLLAQTAPTPEMRRFAVTIGSGENQMVIYVDTAMMPRTAAGASATRAGPMGPLEAVTIGTGEGAMTVYRETDGRMVMTQTALMSRPVTIVPGRAVTVGSGSNEMVIYIEEVQLTPARG
jgi:hypothetical protein